MKDNPYLSKLKEEEESLEEFGMIPKEGILKRWVNFHLKKANSLFKINNFTHDLESGVLYLHLLN